MFGGLFNDEWERRLKLFAFLVCRKTNRYHQQGVVQTIGGWAWRAIFAKKTRMLQLFKGGKYQGAKAIIWDGKKESDLLPHEQKKIKESTGKNLHFFYRDHHAFWVIYLDAAKNNLAQTKEKYRRCASQFYGSVSNEGCVEVLIESDLNKEFLMAFCEGILLSSYQFKIYKSDKKADKKIQFLIHSKSIDAKDLQQLTAVQQAVFFARDLVNEPANILNAVELANRIKKQGQKAGLKVEVFNKKKIEALKMAGLLAVNLGSVDPPTFTVMEYKPSKPINKAPIVFVGKGVVYDTGGMNIKVGAGMETMKCDMGGAATTAAILIAAAAMKLPVHLIGLIPSTDNRPSGNAYVAGDIISMNNGKTIEVLNTDAEGRMILADALLYAKKYNPELVVDFATLTGAAANAIGKYGIVAMQKTDEKEWAHWKNAGEESWERLVEFPLWEEYGELIVSKVGDIKNIGGPVGGAITAGKFLEHFTDYPWIHFDIAGPAFLDSAFYYQPAGGTGVGIRLALAYLNERCKEKSSPKKTNK
jgi:leucyl aminopeptidase